MEPVREKIPYLPPGGAEQGCLLSGTCPAVIQEELVSESSLKGNNRIQVKGWLMISQHSHNLCWMFILDVQCNENFPPFITV